MKIILITKEGKTVKRTIPDEPEGECHDPNSTPCPPNESSPKGSGNKPRSKPRLEKQKPKGSEDNQPS